MSEWPKDDVHPRIMSEREYGEWARSRIVVLEAALAAAKARAKAREEAEAEKMERAIALLESWVDMSMDHSSLTERGVTKQAQRGEATAKFLAELAASGTASGEAKP